MNARDTNAPRPAGTGGICDKEWQCLDDAVHSAFDERLHLRQGFGRILLRLLERLGVGDAGADMADAGSGQRHFRPAKRAVDIGMRVLDGGQRQRLAEQADEPPRLFVHLAALGDIACERILLRGGRS